MRARETVLFIGKPGTGKTHLAIALGVAACRAGYKTRFYTAANLANQLVEARANHALSRIEKLWRKLDLVVLDELSYVPFSREAAQPPQELQPEVVCLGGTHVITKHLPPATLTHPNGHHGGHVDHSTVRPYLHGLGIQPDIRVMPFQRSLPETGHLAIELGADPRDLALADPSR